MPPAASLLGEDANYTLSIADRPSKSVILDAEDVENGTSSVHLVLENIHSITPQKEERRPRLHRIAPVVGQISLYRPSASVVRRVLNLAPSGSRTLFTERGRGI